MIRKCSVTVLLHIRPPSAHYVSDIKKGYASRLHVQCVDSGAAVEYTENSMRIRRYVDRTVYRGCGATTMATIYGTTMVGMGLMGKHEIYEMIH